MKILNTAVWSILLLFLFSTNIWAAPSLVNYQGRLVDTNGNPITGIYDITFTIHAAATGASAVWSEVQTVSLDNGIFSVQLGSVSALGASVFSGDSRWLEVQIGANPPLSPRHRLVSAPYAFTVVSVPESALPSDISLPTQPGDVATKEYVDASMGEPGAGAAILKATQAFLGQNEFLNMITVSSDLFITAGRINVQGNLLTTAGGLLDAGKLVNALPSLDAGALTNLDASNLASGTVPLSVLSGITNAQIAAGAAIADTQLADITTASKVNGSALTGLANVPAGAGNIPANNLANAILFQGTLQTGAVFYVSSGTVNNFTVGSDITLPANSVADNALSANVTLLGNTFNGANQLVRIDGSVKYPALDGSLITNVTASSIAAENVTAGTFDAGVLLNAGSLTNGPVTSSMLPSTVAYTSVSNNFTAAQTISASGGLTLTNGLSAGSAIIGGGLTASSGTFTATGGNQYSIETSSGIKVNNGGVTANFFSGSGAGLTGVLASNVAAADVQDGTLNPGVLLNAGSLTNGPVTSSMLPSTVAYTSVSNNFTAAQTISASGGLTLTNGLSAGSAIIGGGLTASSGTFTATGGNQYSIETSSGIKVNNGGITADGSLDIGGIIITGSGDNQITTAEGLLDAAKLDGTVPVTVTFYAYDGCESLSPSAVAQLCYDTNQHILNVSTIAALGGFAPLHSP